MSGLQQEFESCNDDRVRLQDEVDEMKKRLQTATAEKEAAQRKYQKEVGETKIKLIKSGKFI